MIRRIRRRPLAFSAWLLLGIFLMPTAIKIGHHHDHHDYPAESRVSYVPFHEKCTVCNFEFATFLADENNHRIEQGTPFDSYIFCFYPINVPVQPGFSFLLRGPPSIAI